MTADPAAGAAPTSPPLSPRSLIDLVEARTILTAASGYLCDFDWSLQPYSGCQFHCAYCYVQAMRIQRANRYGRPWGSWLAAKTNAAALLARDVARGRVRGRKIFMSSVTDPYVPAERRLRITRAVLEVLLEAARSGDGPGHLVLQTRSPDVLRDLDLLVGLGRSVVLHMTITTDRDEVRRAFEPDSPSITRRVEALAAARAAGVPTRATISPLLPCDPERLAALLDPVCDEIIVDDLFEGDGARGARSRPSFAIHRAHGWDAWCEPGYHEDALATLRRILGADRVLWNAEGFAAPVPG